MTVSCGAGTSRPGANATVQVGEEVRMDYQRYLRRRSVRGLLAVAVMVGLSGAVGAAAQASPSVDAADLSATGATEFAITATVNGENPRLAEGFQGFSVESADFAHGYLTKDLMAQRLSTLGNKGVVRLGGYSMDLVWPAFGE